MCGIGILAGGNGTGLPVTHVVTSQYLAFQAALRRQEKFHVSISQSDASLAAVPAVDQFDPSSGASGGYDTRWASPIRPSTSCWTASRANTPS